MIQNTDTEIIFGKKKTKPTEIKKQLSIMQETYYVHVYCDIRFET